MSLNGDEPDCTRRTNQAGYECCGGDLATPVGAALNDTGLAGGASPTGRPRVEFISENPQDLEIAAIPCSGTPIAAKAAPTVTHICKCLTPISYNGTYRHEAREKHKPEA